MSLPSPEQFLARLQASPADAAAFDHCRPNMSRRAHVEAVLNAVRATVAETQSLKARLAAGRAKIAAIEAARKSQNSIMKTPITPTKPPAVNTISAAEFSKPQGLFMALAEFNKLPHPQRNRFIREGGKLI